MSKRTASIAFASFVVGTVVGAVVIDALTMRAQPVLRHIVRTNMQIEHEMLASRRARSGRLDESLLHRWSAVRLSGAERDDALEQAWASMADTHFSQVKLLVLDWTVGFTRPSKKIEKGSRIGQAILRQKLAATADSIGLTDLASEQSDLASAVLPEHMRDSSPLEEILLDEASELHVAAEESVLGSLAR